MPLAPTRQAELALWLDIPGQVRAWRKEAHHTQEQAARLIGVTTNTYARWEQGKQAPRVPHDEAAYRVINRWRLAAHARNDPAGT